jgi:hypothetical protein
MLSDHFNFLYGFILFAEVAISIHGLIVSTFAKL